MITTSTGAKKLESSDNWREIFPNPGTSAAGAHNASVDAQDRIQAEIAPIINGKQCALGAASGDYVLLRNSTITGKSDGAYIATKAIPANTDIDSTYLGNAITGGISNSLNNKIAKNNSVETLYDYSTSTPSGGTVNYTLTNAIADYKFISIDFKYGSALVNILIPNEALMQTSNDLSIRTNIYINADANGPIELYKSGTDSISITNRTTVGLAVKISGIWKTA